ncbi:hypothetical protein Emag_006617 [Eimeria magna]
MRAPVSRLLLGPPRGGLLSRPPATPAATASAIGSWRAAAALPIASRTTGSAAAAAAAAALAVDARFESRRHLSSSTRKRETGSHDTSGASSVRAAVEALQEQLAAAAAEKQQRLQRIKTEFGSLEIGAVTPQKIIGGMRGLTALLTETSVLEAESGLRLHGVTLRDLLQRELPKLSEAHEYPPVEALLWFLLTSRVPTPDQVSLLQRCLYEMSLSSAAAAATGAAAASPFSGATEASQTKSKRSSFDFTGFTEERFSRLPEVVPSVLKALPKEGHPMAALVAAAASLSDFSFFRFATEAPTVDKKLLWKAALPDALSLVREAAAAAAAATHRLSPAAAAEEDEACKLLLLLLIESSKSAQQQQSSAAAAEQRSSSRAAQQQQSSAAARAVVRTAVTAATIYANKFGDGRVPQPDPSLDFTTKVRGMLLCVCLFLDVLSLSLSCLSGCLPRSVPADHAAPKAAPFTLYGALLSACTMTVSSILLRLLEAQSAAVPTGSTFSSSSSNSSSSSSSAREDNACFLLVYKGGTSRLTPPTSWARP